MQLELSGRRAGKTYRLIKNVVKSLLEDKGVVIIVPNQGMKHVIAQTFYEHAGVEIEITSTILLSVGELNSFKKEEFIDRHVNDKWYYDELDMMPMLHFLHPNAYYTATPMKLRNFEDLVSWVSKERKDLLLNVYYRATKVNKHVCSDLVFSSKYYVDETIFNCEIMGNLFTTKEGTAG